MKKTKIVFSFDTENFVSPAAAEGILLCISALDEAGVRGCFNVVAMLARQLKAWGRWDIIEALKRHEIDYHTLDHSVHPTINEYTDIADFEKAIELVRQKEAAGIEEVKRTFGVEKLYAFCPPGNSVSAAGIYAFEQLGLCVGAGNMVYDEKNSGVFFCNQYQTEYNYCMDVSLFSADEAHIRADLDALAQCGYVVAYAHPHMIVEDTHWDLVNYFGENTYPFGDWKMANRLTRDQQMTYYRNMRRFFELIKNDERFEITTYCAISEAVQREPERVVTLADCPQILRQLREKFEMMQVPCSLSLSDAVLAARDFLLGQTAHRCGEVFGPAEEPQTVREAITVTRAELTACAAQIADGHPLPANFTVNGVSFGLADWLFAALEVLCGSESAQILPKKQLPSLEKYPVLRDLTLGRSWVNVQWDEKYVSDRQRLQSYTMRLMSE